MSGAATGLRAFSDLKVLEACGPFGAYAGKLLGDLGSTVTRLVSTSSPDPVAAVGKASKDGVGSFYRFVNIGKQTALAPAAESDLHHWIDQHLVGTDLVIADPNVTGDPLASLLLERAVEAQVGTIVEIRGYADGRQDRAPLDDLTAQASGGLMILTGDPEREPLRLPGYQSYFIVGVHAACAAVLGLLRGASVPGQQRLRISVHEAIVHTLETAIQYYTTAGVVRQRKGGAQQAGDGTYPTSTGMVVLGAMTDIEWGRLIDWMVGEGFEDAADLRSWDLEERRTSARRQQFEAAFAEFVGDLPRESLIKSGQAHRVLIAPAYALSELLQDEQLLFDGFFRRVREWDGAPIVIPGPAFRSTAHSLGPWSGAPAPATTESA